MLVPTTLPAQDDAGLQEVVVTAQRREQRLQDVPISVTAISGGDIDKLSIKSATDYLATTPNVSYTEDGQSGARGIGIAIRGINNLVSGENAFVNSVGIYLDEFSVASVPNQVANPLLPDMERIEVLRGPQGTYFGRNSLGGALNLTTRDPTDVFEGSIGAGAETYSTTGDMFNINGVINLPVTDRFKLRGVAYYEDSSGIVKNINPTGRKDSGHQYVDTRVKALWSLTEDTDLKLSLFYSNQRQGTDENVPSGVLDLDSIDTFGITSAFDPGTGFWPDNQDKLSHDLPEKNTLDTFVAVANLRHRFGNGMTLKWISGLIDASQERLFDNDLMGGVDALKRTNKYDGKSWSTELRLEASGERADWTVGALYAQDDQEQFNNVAVSSDPTAPPGLLPPFPEGLGLARNNKNFEVDSLAVFADATLHATNRLDISLGARYTSDDVLNEVASFGIAPVNPPSPPPSFGFFQSFQNYARPPASAKRSFSNVSPRLVFNFKASDNTRLYATVSRGYKAGGSSVGNNTNANDVPFIVPYDEETLTNYEIGMKSEFLDRRVRVNASVFKLDWKDLQMEAFRFLTPGDLSSNFEQTINVPKAEAKGLEIEIVARTSERITIGGAFGYLSSEITEDPIFINALNQPQRGVQITGGFTPTLKGLVLPKAPEITFNAFGEYRWPAAGGDAWIRGEFVHRDGQYSDVEGLTNQQTLGPSPNQGLQRAPLVGEFPYLSPSFDLINLRAGMDWERTSVGLYVQNLTDTKYYTGTQENFGASGIRLRPHPRVIGINFNYKFGGGEAPRAVAPPPPPPPAPVDSDGDGVTDDMDKCPGTPAGARVDARGCELDSDGDGVVDSQDQCPGTPAGAKVDARGCEVDSDGDGVVDSKDKCPGTPKGDRVDEDGCSFKEEIRLPGVVFETNSAELSAGSESVLDRAVATLKRYPELEVEVAGHTDSVGSAGYNKTLSQRRAETVMGYLKAHGVSNSLSARGYGEAQPIASNATDEGRQTNRRVVLRIVGE
ncbi:MAG: TonB-dependent receptor [Steroidobacteraceae bacterium]